MKQKIRLRRALAALLCLLTAVSLTILPVGAVVVPKEAWRLPQIVPEGEVDPNPATEEAADLRKALNIQNAEYQSFIHGEKPAKYQKYIVLHDTEEELDPTGTVGLWLGKNSQKVATHFVIGRDGSVVQCVSLGKIAHHCGWGNAGHNKKFGVPEDGRDDGPSSKPASSVNTDYGMCGWSVGIELCHVSNRKGYTRETDYPEAQLQALDRVIAYIDAYFGFSSDIIVHKEWRTSNSDTSKEFEPYLKNYRKLRTHGDRTLTGTALSGLSNGKGQKLTVKWGLNYTGTGYEVQYSTDKSFQSGVKKKKLSGYDTTSVTLTGLKKKKTYYVRIRTLRDGLHSGWSTVKSIKIKK